MLLREEKAWCAWKVEWAGEERRLRCACMGWIIKGLWSATPTSVGSMLGARGAADGFRSIPLVVGGEDGLEGRPGGAGQVALVQTSIRGCSTPELGQCQQERGKELKSRNNGNRGHHCVAGALWGF